MMKLRDALFCPELAGIFGLCEARERAGRQLAPTNDLRFAGVVAVNGPVLYGKMRRVPGETELPGAANPVIAAEDVRAAILVHVGDEQPGLTRRTVERVDFAIVEVRVFVKAHLHSAIHYQNALVPKERDGQAVGHIGAVINGGRVFQLGAWRSTSLPGDFRSWRKRPVSSSVAQPPCGTEWLGSQALFSPSGRDQRSDDHPR